MDTQPRPLEPLQSSVNMDKSPTRCPFCHEGFRAEQRTLVCDDCLSRHHEECWGDHGSCASCQSQNALSRSQQRSYSGPECACCGVRSGIERTCPGCRKECCGGCFQDRFRGCVDCSVDLIAMAKRHEQVSSSKSLYFTGALFLGVFGIAFLSDVDDAFGGDPGEKLAIYLAITFFAALFLFLMRRFQVNSAEEAELARKLAPYKLVGDTQESPQKS